jgi:hypothetical protein
MEKATVAISSDFLTAFAELPRRIQGKVTDFINKFRNNPKLRERFSAVRFCSRL